MQQSPLELIGRWAKFDTHLNFRNFVDDTSLVRQALPNYSELETEIYSAINMRGSAGFELYTALIRVKSGS